MNATEDTLLHNANLFLWRSDGLSDACKLCGMQQTLPHVSNQCPTSLHLKWYNLEVIVNDHFFRLEIASLQICRVTTIHLPSPHCPHWSLSWSRALEHWQLHWRFTSHVNSPAAIRQGMRKPTTWSKASMLIWWKKLGGQVSTVQSWSLCRQVVEVLSIQHVLMIDKLIKEGMRSYARWHHSNCHHRVKQDLDHEKVEGPRIFSNSVEP